RGLTCRRSPLSKSPAGWYAGAAPTDPSLAGVFSVSRAITGGSVSTVTVLCLFPVQELLNRLPEPGPQVSKVFEDPHQVFAGDLADERALVKAEAQADLWVVRHGFVSSEKGNGTNQVRTLSRLRLRASCGGWQS